MFNAWSMSRDRGSASRGQTRRRRSRQNPIQATVANGAGLPEGAAIARRQHLRREATAPIDFLSAAHFAPSPAGAG